MEYNKCFCGIYTTSEDGICDECKIDYEENLTDEE